MKVRKKVLSLVLALAMTLSLLPALSTTASAASYPSLYPDEYDVTVTQGENAALKFTIFHEFKNEHAYVKVHKGSKTGSVVATADRSFYNTNLMSTWTVNWDTSDVAPGDYVVEYYMTFYSLYSWHETPNHNYLLKVHVKAAPCQNGHSYDAGKVTTTATCGAPGVKTFTCTACGSTKTESIPALSHTWNAGVVTTAPKAAFAGTKTFSCVNCGATRTESVPAIFNDVSSGSYYASAVDWAYQNYVTTGTSATTFSPNAFCTRGQVVTFLWRASGKPEPKATQNPFTDVNASDFFYKAVLWAVEQGITTGTSTTTFSPNTSCSNAQILTFLWRSQGKPDFTGKGTWFEDAVKWATKNKMLDETSASSDVDASCPRADIVTFLYRALDEDAKKDLKHNYGAWTVTKAATCGAEGTKVRTCKDCGTQQIRIIEKVAHKFNAATCAAPSTCTVCGATTGTALSHTWTAATCSNPKICKVCGATDGVALPHSYSTGVCTVCGAKNPNYVKQNLVYQDSKVIITFKELTSKGVVFEVENLTNVNITIQADSISINKKSTNRITMSDDVAPGCIGEVLARCSVDPSEAVGIISGQLRIIDFNRSFDTYDAVFADVIIDSDVNVSVPAVPKTLVYSDDRVKIYYKSVDSSGVTFAVENLTGINITIQADSVAVNKRSVNRITMSDDVAPYSVGDVKAKCSPSTTTGITSVGGTLRIIDFNRSFDTYDATFINVPVVE